VLLLYGKLVEALVIRLDAKALAQHCLNFRLHAIDSFDVEVEV
jgi:hypothetical protein